MKAYIYVGGSIAPEGITERPEQDALILAADCGYRNAVKLGVKPQVLLGDFDSYGEAELPEGVEILRVPAEKDFTDTQMAVKVALERGATEAVLIGGLSGRLDHTLSNLAILEELNGRGIGAVMTDGNNRVRFLRNNSLLLARDRRYRYLSLICSDKKVKGVTLEGCKYPLRGATLTKGNQYAISNEMTGNCALISVKKGGVWIIEAFG